MEMWQFNSSLQQCFLHKRTSLPEISDFVILFCYHQMNEYNLYMKEAKIKLPNEIFFF